MSIFSSIRRSRQSAKVHNAKAAEEKKKEGASTPYKHVPVHAASDALASAPPGWREADRGRVVEQNRRRSAMAASGHNMAMPAMPRVASSLSCVSYPSENVSPMVHLPRTFSYNSVPTGYGSRDVMYSVPDLPEPHQPGSFKGKEVARGHGVAARRSSRRSSPSSSKGEISPVGSSGDSSTSQDDLEMRPAAYTTCPQDGAVPKMHRLAPRNLRRNSDSSNEGRSMGTYVSQSRDSRPPPSVRGFHAIPAAAAPPRSAGPLPGSLPIGHSDTARGHRSFSNSFTGLPPPSLSSSLASAPITPVGVEYDFDFGTSTSADLSLGPSEPVQVVEGSKSLMPEHKDPHSIQTHYTELERIRSAAKPRQYQHSGSIMVEPRGDAANEQIAEALPVAAEQEKSKGRKLSKTGGKLTKKSRWSSSKTSSVAA
ncbi:hypothetical protein S40285_01516 [Stachybotrys chlorohalonatus IBT 40285]|uniref:Uncharacterized protein n=1 Tax=Stachybotrys chlorohalonatus (strain IBT 40285) TaxID=1283841 RepID=A0A084QMN9_STAC4|nr:hypothetical protein S40285_01516 [Stachybotrys chlorohalonata IBT 40285]